MELACLSLSHALFSIRKICMKREKIVLRKMLALGFAVLIMVTVAFGADWPIKLGFQLGFHVRVVPAVADTSAYLGLGVVPDKIATDKEHSLFVTGFITNYNNVPCVDVDMRFAVNSYVGTGISRGVASVEPSTIPPGGTAKFSAHISLVDNRRPRDAMYTITATSPVVQIPQQQPSYYQ